MSVLTKVIIDTKEYQDLKKIAAAYKILVQKKEQSGSGTCQCGKEEKDTPTLSQIAAKNDRDHALSPPEKEIIPSITDPYPETTQNTTTHTQSVENDEAMHFSPDERLEFEDAIAKKDRWYYVGAWKNNVRK